GRREDKGAREVVRERPSPGPRAHGRSRRGRAGSSRGSSSAGADDGEEAETVRQTRDTHRGRHGAATPGRAHGSRSRRPAAAARERVPISHPEKVLFPDPGVTKGELVRYLERVAAWMVPEILDRPLMLKRCPQGYERTCFFQKHEDQPRAGIGHARVPGDPRQGIVLLDATGLASLAQFDVL